MHKWLVWQWLREGRPLLWGRVVDGWQPDRYDLLGGAIALVGVAIIIWGRPWF